MAKPYACRQGKATAAACPAGGAGLWGRMLSYQHSYHAGNAADVHKHAVLAWCLAYLTAKDKPLSYLETHAGRGLYDLAGPEALRTGEAAAGIGRLAARFAPDHPYLRALSAVRAAHGPDAYPGSPLIAAALLRPGDRMHLAELHPREHDALAALLPAAHVVRQDGAAMARALCPPDPRRGLLLIDPAWEVKAEYETIPALIARLHRVWAVGVILLWYPVLTGVDGAAPPHAAMVAGLRAAHPEALVHEVRFAPARPGHRMVGSGIVAINPPWGLEAECARLTALYGREA